MLGILAHGFRKSTHRLEQHDQSSSIPTNKSREVVSVQKKCWKDLENNHFSNVFHKSSLSLFCYQIYFSCEKILTSTKFNETSESILSWDDKIARNHNEHFYSFIFISGSFCFAHSFWKRKRYKNFIPFLNKNKQWLMIWDLNWIQIVYEPP